MHPMPVFASSLSSGKETFTTIDYVFAKKHKNDNRLRNMTPVMSRQITEIEILGKNRDGN